MFSGLASARGIPGQLLTQCDNMDVPLGRKTLPDWRAGGRSWPRPEQEEPQPGGGWGAGVAGRCQDGPLTTSYRSWLGP